MRKHQRLCLCIQLRRLMKMQDLFLQKLRRWRQNVLYMNRLCQSKRSLILTQMHHSPKCEGIHRPLMHLCIWRNIQLRRYTKSRRLFTTRR